jgi:hypothetical protein
MAGGDDDRVAILSFRSLTLWMLGYPEAALSDADDAIKDARKIGHAPGARREARCDSAKLDVGSRMPGY